jgi:hypothetical protein
MAEVAEQKKAISSTAQPTDDHVETMERVKQVNAAIARTDEHLDERHVPLGWRSWMVVMITFFG